MVHLIQQLITEHLKVTLPQIRKLEYFSDGCAGQYKNKKNFYNLCQHEKDFGLEGTWNFFATSHGKSPCDGIDGTVESHCQSKSAKTKRESYINTTTDVQLLFINF